MSSGVLFVGLVAQNLIGGLPDSGLVTATAITFITIIIELFTGAKMTLPVLLQLINTK